MGIDIFQFWSEIGSKERVHPRDREVLFRVKHNFDLKCLPASFMGPLKKAPVVLLYLSPGLDKADVKAATTKKERDRYQKTRKGDQPLPNRDAHEGAWKWWTSRTKRFGEWEDLRDKIAFLNIGAYHSKTFDDAPLLAALPSSRMSLEWAQNVLFPEAIAGKRVVVCLRGRKYWGLDGKQHHGKALFAPNVTRAGYMKKEPLAARIERTVKAAIG